MDSPKNYGRNLPNKHSVIVPTYFKPLRRKIGIVTLVIACVFMALWVRSYLLTDHVVSSVPNGGIVSKGGSVCLILDEYMKPDALPQWRVHDTHFVYPVFDGDHLVDIPHDSIVLPLTLLSAWLLLSKPQVATQRETVEPLQEKAV